MKGRKGRGKIPESAVAEALKAAHGFYSGAARALGISRQSVRDRVKKSPALRAVVDDCLETHLDEAESRLTEAIDRGEPWAVRFLLECKGRPRGYCRVPDPAPAVAVVAPPRSLEELKAEAAKYGIHFDPDAEGLAHLD